MRVPIAMIGFACGLAFAQAQEPKLTFEVASVRPAEPKERPSIHGGPGTEDPLRISYTGLPLSTLLVRAYGVQEDQISGPAWMASTRFDLSATVPAGATTEQVQEMLRTLLVDRFHLVFHREQKDFVVWELGPAKNGPKLKQSGSGADDGVPAGRSERGGVIDKDGFPVPPPHQSATRSPEGVAKMAGRQITMKQLAGDLRFPVAMAMEGPSGLMSALTLRVEDKTGLPGEYDIKLEYDSPGQHPPGAAPTGEPDLFTALQQQLGLKLQKSKANLDVLVIDHAGQTPADN